MIEMSIILMSMITGQVWIIMIQPDYLFDFMGRYIDMVKAPKVRHLVTCSTCMAGQISLWAYLAASLMGDIDYSPLYHFITVTITIWLTALSSKMFNS